MTDCIRSLSRPSRQEGFRRPFRIVCEFGGVSGQVALDHLRALDRTRLLRQTRNAGSRERQGRPSVFSRNVRGVVLKVRPAFIAFIIWFCFGRCRVGIGPPPHIGGYGACQPPPKALTRVTAATSCWPRNAVAVNSTFSAVLSAVATSR